MAPSSVGSLLSYGYYVKCECLLLTRSQTPAQSRFILPRKSQPSQTQKQNPVALQDGARQFASTPRFNVSGTPRQASHQQAPPPFSTPAPPSTRPRATPFEPLSDAIDTSPISAEIPGYEDEGLDQNSLNESIEIDSPSASRSTFDQDEPPPPKRRRVSISPELDIGSERDATDELMEEPEQIEIPSTPTQDDRLLLRPRTSPRQPTTEPSPRPPPEQQQQQQAVAPRHPTFRNAPRFKAVEPPAGAQQQHPLPDAFSPQRRGAKYVPGGLAAEVRDWLVQVKGASEYDRPAGEGGIGAVVDEVQSGAGVMHIIAARRPGGEAGDGEGDGDGCVIPFARAILAGDGRTAGLGGRSVVEIGGLVFMSQPMWDLTLDDLGHFAVACDWEASG